MEESSKASTKRTQRRQHENPAPKIIAVALKEGPFCSVDIRSYAGMRRNSRIFFSVGFFDTCRVGNFVQYCLPTGEQLTGKCRRILLRNGFAADDKIANCDNIYRLRRRCGARRECSPWY